MNRLPLISTAFAVAAIAPASAVLSLPTTGVYDVASANNVDTVAGVGAITTGSAGEISFLDYSARFAAAFADGKGGVIQFDGVTSQPGDSSPELDNNLSVSYGVGQTLSISRPTGEYQFNSTPTTLGTPISGTMYLRTSGDAFHVFNFSSPLTTLGFTVLSRNSSRTILATVTYFEGGTATISGEVVAGGGGDDTFFGFTAEAGKNISSLRIEATATGEAGNNFFAIDDLAFIVPEPSVSLLSAAGLAGLLIRRRRLA